MTLKRTTKNSGKSVIMIAVLTVLVIVGFLLLFTNPLFWFKKSIHEDAKRYSTKHCLVFYPENEYGKEFAKSLCKDVKDDRVYDYTLVPYGDYYFVSYGSNIGYFVDSNYQTIHIDNVNDDAKKIIVDYLRYTIKKEQPEKYYNAEFLASTVVDNIDFTNVTYDIEAESLKCHFPNYELEVLVPLKYIQEPLEMNFGFHTEKYTKPVYISRDANHPVICLTFDDGPNFWNEPGESSSVSIVDTLYKYDANATFYTVGDCLEERDVWTDYQAYSFLKKSVSNGNEYGSHTSYHEALDDMSTAENIKNAIEYPAEFMYDLLQYDMVTYRPPGGFINDFVISAQPYPAIMWSLDSDDWSLRDASAIYEKVINMNFDDGDVVLFHDIYDETAEAIKKIVPELINRGYQLVTIKDMLQFEEIDINNLHYYYNINPWPYYN